MGWSNQKLGDYCEVIAGQSPEGKYYNDSGEGLPFYQGKKEFGDRFLGSPKKWTSKVTKEAKAGDILMSVRAPVGPINFSTQDICIGRGLAAIRSSDKLDKDFLFYYLLSKQDEIQGSEGAVFASINKAQIEALSFSYVEIKEQKRIVAILDQAFADIEQARAKTEQNLKNARELFESYLQQVFSQRGEGWVERTLEEISKVGSSKRIYETDWTRSGVPFYGGKEIVKLAKHGSVISNAYISEKKYEDYSSKYDMPQKGDILMTARGTIGVSYIVKEGDKFYYKDGNIISLRPKLNINPQFILYAFKSKQILDQLKNLSGTTVNHLPLRKAKELALYIPDLNAQIDTVNKIKKIEANSHQLIDVYESKLVALDQLKKSILQKAFSGELAKTLEVDTNKGAVA